MDKRLKSLCDFIQANPKNWDHLLKSEPYYLKIRQHPFNTDWYMFSYDMIRSDFSNDICKVARGLILDIRELNNPAYFKDKRPPQYFDIRVVIRAFDKFHNYGEGAADNIDWNGKIYAREKLDGSLIKCTPNWKRWDTNTIGGMKKSLLWTTNNGFNVDSELPGDLICEFSTFKDLIREALKDLKADWMIDGEPIFNFGSDITLIFELVSPFNRIVVPYPKTELYLLGVRDNDTGEEETPESFLKRFCKFGFPKFKTPKLYELTAQTLDEVVEIVSKLDTNHEGIVIQDEHFNRVKVKSEQYLAIHKMKDNNGQLSSEHVLKCIQLETVDDILAMFPENADAINKVIDVWKKVGSDLDRVTIEASELINDVEHCGDDREKRKLYAMAVKDRPYSKMYFDLYKDFSRKEFWKQQYMNDLDYETLMKLGEVNV